MAEHSRDWWIHESEHVLVIILLMVVLFQATQIAAEEGASAGDPVVIVPPSESFTVYSEQTVNFPWLVVNRLDEPLRVKSGISLEWETLQRTEDGLPDSLTAFLVKPRYIDIASLSPGAHKEYAYTFTAPDEPGRYVITIAVEGDGTIVEKTVQMRVVDR